MPVPSPITYFLRFGKLFFFNVFVFFVAILCILLPDSFPFSPLFCQFTLLFTLLPTTAINLTAITERLARRTFSWLERIFIATTLSLIIPPLFVTLTFTLFHTITPYVPLFLTLGSFLLAIIIYPHFLDKRILLPKKDLAIITAISIFFLLFVLIIVRAFYALPDLDPYYWLSLYQKEFSQGQVTPLHLYRPLFSSLSYIFIVTAGVDGYAYFKYVLPFFFFLLILPLSLLAQHFQNTATKTLVYFLPFVTASFALYISTPIPQALLNIGLILFCVSILQSFLNKDSFFLFFGGFLILSLSFYHEAASIIFFIWLISTLLFYRQNIKKIYRENPLLITLLGILFTLQTISLFGTAFHFILYWIGRVYPLLSLSHFNLSYPLNYTNVDGMTVGWSTLSGVARYYLFYAGPVFLVSILVAIQLLRKNLFSQIKFSERPEGVILLVSSLFFFCLAEILPRFFDIALLPERALGFAALFGVAFFFLWLPLLKTPSFHWLPYVLIFCFLINVGGALYINNLKQYLITPSQVVSANWMRANIGNKAVVMSYGNENLLRTHAQVTVFKSDDLLFYVKRDSFDKLYQKAVFQHLDTETPLYDYIEDLDRLTRSIRFFSETHEKASLISEITLVKESSDDILKVIKKSGDFPTLTQQEVYVYYASTSPNNPYAKRPYIVNAQETPLFIFDQIPDFKRIYSLPDEEVIIWQYTP